MNNITNISFGLNADGLKRFNLLHEKNKEESRFKIHKTDTCRFAIENALNSYQYYDLIKSQINYLELLYKRQIQLSEETKQALDELYELKEVMRG